MHWLRNQLFDGAKTDAERAAHLVGHDVSELGPATVALCEDYMLSYGRLRPFDAARRGDEIAALAARVSELQRSDGTFPGADENLHLAVWPMWGLDAAARTGVVVPPA